MLVYDGLMLLPKEANREELAQKATEAASAVIGCHVNTRFKRMELPPAMIAVMERDAKIVDLQKQIAELKLQNKNQPKL